jgi:hypothetical protein
MVAVGVADADNDGLGMSRRQVLDLVPGWNTFAVDGTWAAQDSEIDVIVENASDCSVEVGSGPDALPPAIRFLDPDPSARLVSTEQAWVYERPNAWPLLSTHARWRHYDNQEQALADIAVDDGAITYVGPRRTFPQGEVAPDILESRITRQGAVAVTDGPEHGIVVFSQNDALGWNAYVDGVPTEHVSIDGALLGVFVPPGRHTVEFAYEPWHFPVGVAVSLSTALILVLAVLIGWVRTRRRSVR